MTPSGARLLHAALVIAILVLVLALAVVRAAAGIEDLGLPIAALRITALVLLVGTLIGQRIVRAHLSPLRARGDAEAWWRTHGSRVLTVWALSDALATAGAVFWFLTGDVVVLAIGTGVGLVLLLATRPAGLDGGW